MARANTLASVPAGNAALPELGRCAVSVSTLAEGDRSTCRVDRIRGRRAVTRLVVQGERQGT
jgi:hypothetical protein